MGCSNCSNNTDGKPNGCKGNGDCGSYGCSKMDVFDWLADMDLGIGQTAFNVVEVRFKNSRKAFYRNTEGLSLHVGDVVAVEASPGHDVGVVSAAGELVRIQMQRKNVRDNHEVLKVYRKAKEEDVAIWQEARQIEDETMHKARSIATELGLEMKISDVEYQGDKKKVTFFYTAEGRVDFRELIKRLADTFRTRIDMRQIGARQEASRLGGIGSCGRELCCSTWLTDFRSVSTSAARYQQLSLNPSKLAGQCGKLKCCLNYELDQYMEAVKLLPSTNVKLHTQRGIAFHFKTDIFKKIVWYIYEDQAGGGPVPLEVDAVNEIIAMNKAGEKPADLSDFEIVEEIVEETDYLNVVGQDSLTRFDKRKPRNKRRKGGKGRGPKAKTQGGQDSPNKGKTGGSPKPKEGGNRGKSKGGQQSGQKSSNNPKAKSGGAPKGKPRPPRNKNTGSKPGTKGDA